MLHEESNSERLTRKRRIDPLLDGLGWKRATRPGRGACRVEEFETENGPADYALCLHGQAVGIVEAKKLSLGPQGVLVQAERYSRGVTRNPLGYRTAMQCRGSLKLPNAAGRGGWGTQPG